MKYDGKNILDIAIEEQDIKSINFLIDIIKQKCPDFFKKTNVGNTLIKKLNVISGNLDDNGLKKIKFLNELISRTMSANKTEAAEVSGSVLKLEESSIEHQDSTTYNAPSPRYRSPTKSSLAKNNTKTPNTQSGKQPDSRCTASNKPSKDEYKTCKSFIKLLSHKPQKPGYQGSTISSDLRKSPKSKAGFDSSTHEGNTPPLEFDPIDLINKTEVDSCRFSKRSKSLDRGDPKTSERFMSQSWSESCKLGLSVKASDKHPCKYSKIKSNKFRHLIESSSSDDEQSEGISIFGR